MSIAIENKCWMDIEYINALQLYIISILHAPSKYMVIKNIDY